MLSGWSCIILLVANVLQYSMYMHTSLVPQATPRFYLAAVEKNRLRDKIWEWPGNEATCIHDTVVFINYVQFK